MANDFDSFYREYTKAIDGRYAALFAGAGLSRSAGYVDWKGLLKDIAQDLNLDIDQESDLIALAQYHVSQSGGRHRINQKLIEEFLKDVQLTKNHQLIARLPLHTVWTTNYDKLLEQAFEDAYKKPDVKITQANLSITRPNSDVTIYKMHGDISLPDKAVLTKEDYETYDVERSLFSEQLKGDLIKKTFLFLGFSFTDPNIDYILSRVRTLMGQNQRQHYCIMARPQPPKGKLTGRKKAQYEYQKTKFELRIADLRRYMIQALLIDDYDEIPEILEELNRRAHRNNIFVSGSAHEFGSFGRGRTEKLAYEIGQEVIRRGYNLVSGFGLGIGGTVVLGGMEALYRDKKARTEERTILRPFPQGKPRGMTRAEFWTKYRGDMISKTGFSIFICGNKRAKNTTVMAGGVLEEFEITKARSKYPIPIGSTGYAAEQIWKEVTKSLKTFYPKGGVKAYFDVLGDPTKTNKEIVDAVFGIVEKVVSD